MSDDVYAIHWLLDHQHKYWLELSGLGARWLVHARVHLEARLDRDLRSA